MKKTLSLFAVLVILSACGGRVPTPQSAHSITESFFKKYGKKYKGSVFGQAKINKVEIQGIREQSRNFADVEAFVATANGEKSHVLMTFKKVPPFGWRVHTWEMIP